VIDIAENLRYLKSLGFKVKTYEEIFGEGELKGREKGRKEGLQEGLQEGLREAILLGIELRFGKVGLRYKQKVKEIKGIERLKRLKKAILEVKSLQEFEEILRKVKEE